MSIDQDLRINISPFDAGRKLQLVKLPMFPVIILLR